MVAFAFFFVSVAVAIPADAAVTSVQIRVDGLACPFCAFGLEKKIKQHVKVKDYNVDFEQGLVTVVFKQEETFTIKQFKQAVKEAGFTYKSMTATLRGTPAIKENPNGNAIVVIEDPKKELAVLVADSSDTHEALFEQVKAGERADTVEVRGEVREHTAGAKEAVTESNRTDFYLLVQRFRAVGEDSEANKKNDSNETTGDNDDGWY